MRKQDIASSEKSTKSSAHYQREFRKRMREQGLVKKELWVRSENVHMLAGVESRLRELRVSDAQVNEIRDSYDDSVIGSQLAPWTVGTLSDALLKHPLFTQGLVELELLEEDPILVVTMKQYANLPIFISVTGEQIIAETVLWSKDQVKDHQAFNELVLRTHKYLPLSSLALESLEGKDYYCLFGSLSARSILESIVFEIESLAENAVDALDTYSDMLR